MKKLLLYGAALAGFALLFGRIGPTQAEPPAVDLTQTQTMSTTTGASFGVMGQALSDTIVGTSTYDIVSITFFYADGKDSTDTITLAFKYGSTTTTMKQRVFGGGTTVVGPLAVRADSVFVTTTGANATDWYYQKVLALD